MKFKLIDCIDIRKSTSLKTKPLKISSKDANDLFGFLDKKFGKIVVGSLFGKFTLGYVIDSQEAFIRAVKKDAKDIEISRHFINVSSRDLSKEEIIEVFNGILENGYTLRFSNLECRMEIRSLEELMIKLELERQAV